MISLSKTISTISRTHAKIYWDDSRKEYGIEVLSKNGLRVNDVPYTKGQKVLLSQKASLRIGSLRLFFTVPQNARPYNKGVAQKEEQRRVEAMRSAALDRARGGAMDHHRRGKSGYTDVVARAFLAPNLPRAAEGGATLGDIVEWVVTSCPEFKEPVKRQGLVQGVLATLEKFYQRSTSEPSSSASAGTPLSDTTEVETATDTAVSMDTRWLPKLKVDEKSGTAQPRGGARGSGQGRGRVGRPPRGTAPKTKPQKRKRKVEKEKELADAMAAAMDAAVHTSLAASNGHI